MTLQQYRNLSDEHQMHYFKHKAVIVAALRRKNEVHTLFQLSGFYIEVITDEAAGVKSSINYFEDTELLTPYLKLININSVYEVLNLKK